MPFLMPPAPCDTMMPVTPRWLSRSREGGGSKDGSRMLEETTPDGLPQVTGLARPLPRRALLLPQMPELLACASLSTYGIRVLLPKYGGRGTHRSITHAHPLAHTHTRTQDSHGHSHTQTHTLTPTVTHTHPLLLENPEEMTQVLSSQNRAPSVQNPMSPAGAVTSTRGAPGAGALGWGARAGLRGGLPGPVGPSLLPAPHWGRDFCVCAWGMRGMMTPRVG